MSLCEDLRTIKKREEGPIFKIERNQANAFLKEAIINHTGLIIPIRKSFEDLNNGNRLIEVKVIVKMKPTEEAKVVLITNNIDSPSGSQSFAGYSITEYQFSGSGILLKRNATTDALFLEPIREGHWEVVETNEINVLTDCINNPFDNSEKAVKIWSSKKDN